jgi:uncharacterized protein (UPF0332 family)
MAFLFMVEEKKSADEFFEGSIDMQKYSNKKPIIPQNSSEVQKELEKSRKELEKFKGWLLKKYNFVQALSILPQQSIKKFVEEEEVPKETENFIHLYMLIPENKFKEIPKLKKEIIPELEKLKQKVWLQIKTPVDVWENCLDSKFEIHSAISLSYPLYDKGFLEKIRIAEIHKSLVLQKFEKYIVSYVIWGSLARGDKDMSETSDIDVGIVIDDTDVKRMPRLELRERLRSFIVNQFAPEATALAGSKKNLLNVNTWLLTEFWDGVKDANPVFFTFIRDGVPVHDRGTFMPWRCLLKMGKLKPSPEAIDMFMSGGDKAIKRAKLTILDVLIHDIYWSVLTPAQALLMLYGEPPPAPKHTVEEFKKVFYTKEKIIEKKHVDFLESVIKVYKGYEHGTVKEIKGADLDKFIRGTQEYIKRLEELRKDIEARAQKNTIEKVHQEVFELLRGIFGKKSESILVKEFEEKLVKQGKFTQSSLKALKIILSAKNSSKNKKVDKEGIEEARKKSVLLINSLVDYSQRCELAIVDKSRMVLKFDEKRFAELIACPGESYIFFGQEVKKITDKVYDSTVEEATNAIQKRKKNKSVNVKPDVFGIIRKEFGEFELVL